MTKYEKYVEEHCKNCKNKDKDLCEIRVSTLGNVTVTKCGYYEKDKS